MSAELHLFNDIFKRLQLIGYNCLLDRFGFDMDEIHTFYEYFDGTIKDYCVGEYKIADFINWNDKNEFYIYDILEKIPVGNQIKLCSLSQNRGSSIKYDEKMRIVKTAIVTYLSIANIVLRISLELPNCDIHRFDLVEIPDYIDSCVRQQPKNEGPYLTSEMIRNIFIDEQKTDIYQFISYIA